MNFLSLFLYLSVYFWSVLSVWGFNVLLYSLCTDPPFSLSIAEPCITVYYNNKETLHVWLWLHLTCAIKTVSVWHLYCTGFGCFCISFSWFLFLYAPSVLWRNNTIYYNTGTLLSQLLLQLLLPWLLLINVSFLSNSPVNAFTVVSHMICRLSAQLVVRVKGNFFG